MYVSVCMCMCRCMFACVCACVRACAQARWYECRHMHAITWINCEHVWSFICFLCIIQLRVNIDGHYNVFDMLWVMYTSCILTLFQCCQKVLCYHRLCPVQTIEIYSLFFAVAPKWRNIILAKPCSLINAVRSLDFSQVADVLDHHFQGQAFEILFYCNFKIVGPRIINFGIRFITLNC